MAGGVCDKRGDLQLRPPVPNWGGYHPSYVVKRAELGHHGGAPNVVSLLPQAAKLYTTQLERGLGHPAHTADARAALKRLVGGRITLQRGKTAGSLFAAYNFQRTALLAGMQVQRGSGAGFLKITREIIVPPRGVK